MVDHVNGDGLDNRKANLRICNDAQNRANSSRRKGTFSSKYKGVNWCKKLQKWVAGIGVNHKRVDLGYFVCEEDAARAYNVAAIKYHREFAQLNEL